MVQRVSSKLFAIWLAVMMLLMTFACAPAGPPVTPKEVEKVIKLGLIIDFTGAYAAAHSGAWLAWQAFWRDLEDQGGLQVAGQAYHVEYLWGDNHYDTARSVAILKDHVAKGVVGVTGWWTGESEALKPHVERAQVPYQGAGTTRAIVDPPGWVFGQSPLYPEYTASLAEIILARWEEARAPKFAFLSWDTSFGRGFSDPTAVEYCKSRGLEVVGNELFPVAATDVLTQMKRLQALNPDFILVTGAVTQQAMAAKAALELGIRPPKVQLILGSTNMCNGLGAKLAGAEAYEGQWAIGTDATLSEKDVPGVKKYAYEVFQEYHGFSPPAQWSTYNMALFSCLFWKGMITNTLERVGYPFTGADVYKTIVSTSNMDMMGVFPPISYSDTCRVPNHAVRLCEYKAGQAYPLTQPIGPKKAFYAANSWMGYTPPE